MDATKFKFEQGRADVARSRTLRSYISFKHAPVQSHTRDPRATRAQAAASMRRLHCPLWQTAYVAQPSPLRRGVVAAMERRRRPPSMRRGRHPVSRVLDRPMPHHSHASLKLTYRRDMLAALTRAL